MSATRVSAGNQITIPAEAARKLRLEVGDLLRVEAEGENLVLVPKRPKEHQHPPRLSMAERKALDRLRKKIGRIRKDLGSSRGLTGSEADLAVKTGLIARDQRWWWLEEWQRGEREAEHDLRSGRARVFENAEDLIRDLRAR